MDIAIAEDFRTSLTAHAQLAVERAPRALTEAAAQQYLVLPFLQLLGYDPLNPDEIVPEAHASFSDKFKNRVDYAICRDGQPVIAVECKRVGALVEANRGELKGYFNAVPTVKLGILTDGLVFQLYTDTGLENMMDDAPFAVVDLAEIAQGQVTDNTLDALLRLRNGTFDPADVGADARRKLYTAAYVDALRKTFDAPPEPFVRVMMDIAAIDGRRTSKLVDEHRPILQDALRTFFDRMILERVGFAERHDLVRVPTIVAAPVAEPAKAEPVAEPPSTIVTTDTEAEVYQYVRERLPFLIERDEALYEKIQHVHAVDHKTVYCIYYRQERKGRLLNFWETAGSRLNFEFPTESVTIAPKELREIDPYLLAAFLSRAEALG